MHFVLSWGPTLYSFTFNLQFFYELNHMVHLSRNVCRILYFRFPPFFKKSWFFCLTKSMDSLKRLNFFQNKNDKKSTNSFASRLLIFKLQLEAWKFNNICVSWISAKTNLKTNFSNLGNQSFEYFTFSQ